MLNTTICPFFRKCLKAGELEVQNSANKFLLTQCLGLDNCSEPRPRQYEKKCSEFKLLGGENIKFCIFFKDCKKRVQRAINSKNLYTRACLGIGLKSSFPDSCSQYNPQIESGMKIIYKELSKSQQ